MDNLTNFNINQSINGNSKGIMTELLNQTTNGTWNNFLDYDNEEMNNGDLDKVAQSDNSDLNKLLNQQESTFLDTNTTTEIIPTNTSIYSLPLETSTNVIEVEYTECDCPMIDTKDFEIGAIIGATVAFGIFLVIMLIRICMKKREEIGPCIRCFFCL
ncbi:hypothetical protein ACQ4LE_010265 [Meloidogyne hapla]